ncbi:hypothetical protein V1527DRAFT_514866 [Lipomyces starkeyi]
MIGYKIYDMTSQNASTQMTPFYASFGYDPTWTFDLPTGTASIPDADRLETLARIQRDLRSSMRLAQEDQARYHNRYRRPCRIFDRAHIASYFALPAKNASLVASHEAGAATLLLLLLLPLLLLPRQTITDIEARLAHARATLCCT